MWAGWITGVKPPCNVQHAVCAPCNARRATRNAQHATDIIQRATSRDAQVYTFDNAENQWRMLRVRNGTHDASYVEWCVSPPSPGADVDRGEPSPGADVGRG